MPKLQANGIELFYDIQGTGEPLLLIPGFACDYAHWDLLMPSLVAQYQVIRFDNRGIGQSSVPDSPYSIKQMADDTAILLEHVGVSKVHVAGHSMGGQIAQELALAHPEKVYSLMLLATFAKGDRRFCSIIETLGDLPRILDPEAYFYVVLPWAVSEDFYSTPGAIEEALQFQIEYLFPPTPQGLYHQSRAIVNSDTLDRLPQISCPTLVVVSQQDILIPIKFSQELVQGIPNAELVILERGGHDFLIDAPDAVSTAMLNFLAKHTK
ncbi:alpha/beta fold hydrolase [Gloeocapsopsis crepidinum LEGE 06123]|uniref:Alpha/beta fold hydrolase n=1 Tax=Gloeocapsopsis crepidinum LEGE 06123 TaxID=588587 RepID=A0ABR9UTL0_9CHRO|nr:alpha/beta hydrolase [Gloeocapsopsis crepidinum]MBE9190930.1 alpha/beta fold hydrolase [Gloeocapsopsis crepidinum LEGE 06123]